LFPGLKLLTQAYEESTILARAENEGSPALTRGLYLYGVIQLLRGLPKNLSAEEILNIQAALPASVLDRCNLNVDSLKQVSRRKGSDDNITMQQPSLLHRIVAITVFQLFILLNVLLPYVRLFIGHAYRLERKHRVMQRVFSKSIKAVDDLGRKGIQTVCQMNEGKVGQAIHDLTLWWVHGLTGGIQQGVLEGIVVLGAEMDRRTKEVVEVIE
jgi:hypothetical protein